MHCSKANLDGERGRRIRGGSTRAHTKLCRFPFFFLGFPLSPFCVTLPAWSQLDVYYRARALGIATARQHRAPKTERRLSWVPHSHPSDFLCVFFLLTFSLLSKLGSASGDKKVTWACDVTPSFLFRLLTLSSSFPSLSFLSS